MNLDNSKLQYHPIEVSKWLTTGSAFPLYVELSPLNTCNHKCIMCGLDFFNKNNEKYQYNTETILSVISELLIGGTKSIMIAGAGESLLHKDLPKIVSHAKSKGIDVAITTNGSIDNDFESLKQNCSWIKISFGGGDRETYKLVHGVDMFDKVVENIKKLVSLPGNSEISMQFLLLKENIHSLESFLKLAGELKVDRIILKPYSNHLMSENKRDDYYDDITIGFIDSIVSKYPELPINFRKKTAMTKTKEYDRCYSAGQFWAYIEANGDVYSCSCFIGDDRFIIGNINEQSFHDIWNGQKRKENLKMLETFDIKQCRQNCRFESNNKYLWELKNADRFRNFI